LPYLKSIPLFNSIAEYNFRINIPEPRYEDFDIRDFKENMKSVHLKMNPFRISFFQIALLESGGGTVSSEGKPYELSDYTLFFNLPGQIIHWEVPQDWKGYYLCANESFYSVRLDGYQRLFDLPFFKTRTSAIQLQKTEASAILHVMQKANAEYTNIDSYNQIMIKSYLATILALSIRFFGRYQEEYQQGQENRSLGERFKETVHRYLNDMVLNIRQEPLSVARSADRLFVTPKHLSTVVKKELGITPTEYINSRLIAEAQKLLLSTEMQIKEISYLLGFQDNSYFNRVFRKELGLSPKEFKARNINKAK